MGYTIRIGNATPYHERYEDELIAKWRVEPAKHDAAPAFGEPTDKENQRWPSYTAWAGSMRALGLYDLFLSGDGLMAQHPGCKIISREHVEQVLAAVERRRATNGGRPAGFFKYDAETHQEIDTGSDPDLARGEWLAYWMKWAIENCETPAIENS
jgi:hypothetical protein